MPYRVVIDFDIAPQSTRLWATQNHRIHNLSEELYRAFRDGKLARHDVVDHATSRLVVAVKSKAKVRSVHAIVEKMLEEHFPDKLGAVRVEQDSPD